MMQAHALTSAFDDMVEEGRLRPVGHAFAGFIAEMSATPTPVVLVCALLSELEGRGHSCLRLGELAEDPCALLGWTAKQWADVEQAVGRMPATVDDWRSMLAGCSQVWETGLPDDNQPLVLDGERLYLRRYFAYENRVAHAVKRRAGTGRLVDIVKVRAWLDKLFGTAREEAAPNWQKIACAVAVRSTLSIITGGPGTGKTYTVARLLTLLFALADEPHRLRIALAAPTGKAAARLKQSIEDALTGLAAQVAGDLPLLDLASRLPAACTLHTLLGARPDTRSLRHHAGNPLEIDVLVVDEASMVHLEMMASLLQALPPNAMVVLLGDKDQLESVEAGAVLGDLCLGAERGGYAEETAQYVSGAAGETIPAAMIHGEGALAQQTVMLRQSHRFGGPIGELALAVNAGDADGAMACLREGGGHILHWMEAAGQEQLLRLAVDGRVGAEGGYRAYLQLLEQGPAADSADAHGAWVAGVLKAFDAFRILCAVREGAWGVAGINQAVEQRLAREGLIQRRGEWYVGRPVMVTRNDYGARVFNGDIGIALPDPARRDAMRVYFLEGDEVRSVPAARLAEVQTTYAMTVHKSQGSEFRHVAVVLPKEVNPVMTRELVYTGITRARKEFTLVTPMADGFAESVQRKTRRGSGLRDVLASAHTTD